MRNVKNEDNSNLQEKIVEIRRVTKVVKGGRRFSFSALVVVGDNNGSVGYGLGKAKEVPEAIKKGIEKARKNLIKVPIENNTIPFQVVGKYGAGKVFLKPASEGTGTIAGGAVKAVLEVCGIKNILTKCLGSRNSHNSLKATIDGLKQLKSKDEILKIRGLR